MPKHHNNKGSLHAKALKSSAHGHTSKPNLNKPTKPCQDKPKKELSEFEREMNSLIARQQGAKNPKKRPAIVLTQPILKIENTTTVVEEKSQKNIIDNLLDDELFTKDPKPAKPSVSTSLTSGSSKNSFDILQDYSETGTPGIVLAPSLFLMGKNSC